MTAAAAAVVEAEPLSPVLARSTGISNPFVLLERAIEKGIDPDQLGKLLDLQERWERNRAAERFGDALANFQADCPAVFKHREANAGSFKYKFESFDDVMRAAGPVMAKHGISVAFDTEHNQEKHIITIVVRVRVGSYFEDRKFSCPVPADLKATEPQKYGAALSFVKRYGIKAALNIVSTDVDNDAAGLLEHISPDDVKELLEIIAACEKAKRPVDQSRFLEWLNVKSLEELPAKEFAKAKHFLTCKRDGVKA